MVGSGRGLISILAFFENRFQAFSLWRLQVQTYDLVVSLLNVDTYFRKSRNLEKNQFFIFPCFSFLINIPYFFIAYKIMYMWEFLIFWNTNLEEICLNIFKSTNNSVTEMEKVSFLFVVLSVIIAEKFHWFTTWFISIKFVWKYSKQSN